MALVLGIMGKFASGKSLATSYFIDQGFFEIDADQIGKEALFEKKDAIIKEFGSKVLERDKISPQKLGSVVFSSLIEMEKLNSIVHPWMKSRIQTIIREHKDLNIVLHAAILPQLGLKELCGRVLFIDCREEILIQRGVERNQFNAQKIKNILKMQEEKNHYIENATDIIENNGTREELYKKLDHYKRNLFESHHTKS